MLIYDGFSQRLSFDTYWVNLSDKKGSLYSVSRPEEFLSPRALERRTNSGIPILEEDLPVSQEYYDSISSLGIEILGSTKWFNALIIRSTDSLKLSQIPNFSFVRNFSTAYSSFSFAEMETFSDSSARRPPASTKTVNGGKSLHYGGAGKQISLLGGNLLHDYGYKGSGRIIAVLDGGFYKTNQIDAFRHLYDKKRILLTRDFVEPESEFYTHSTHGMHVLSTMAAFVPGVFVGTAPEASYMLFRSEETKSENKIEEAWWVLAAELADSAGADIITTSLGYYDFPGLEDMNYTLDELNGKNALVSRAAEKAFEKGMIVIASAGNEGTNNNWEKITPPADGLNVLAVGSIDTAKNATSYSSRGYTSDGRIKPDVMAVGFQTQIVNSQGVVSNGYGTSYAAPQIAGLTACLWQANPEKTNAEIISAIRESGNQFANPDSISGYGIPDFMLAHNILRNSDISEHPVLLTVYPNPFHSGFEIRNNYRSVALETIRIYDSAGKLVYRYPYKILPGQSLSIQHMETCPVGVFYISAKSGGKEIVRKIIKQ